MSSASEGPSRPLVKSLNQIQVLVVQCNPADGLLTMEAFKAAGLTTGLQCVPEGQEALMYVQRKGPYAKAPVPDLIFLDLSQPKASGLEVLKVIKSTPALMHIPIVVAAGSDDPKFVRSVYALNGNCFIRKPGELPEFVRFIESCYHFWSNVVTLAPPSPKRRRTAPSGAIQGNESNSQQMVRFASDASHK
jgi:chemotaxis family two-component system response regulator Rcp1